MRLVVDCFKLVKGAGKSIGIYNLARHLVQELAKEHGTNEIIVFGNSYNQTDFDAPGVTFIQIDKNPLNKLTCIVWELFEVSVRAKKLKADKILFPRGYASMLHLTKEAVIIHDMIPFYYHEHYPDYFNKLENFYIMWRLKASARKADDVITISDASKQDIIRYAGVSESRITVINNGYNAITRKNYAKPDEDYIIAVTSSLPHKNAKGIVQCYEQYRHMNENPLPLKIVGIDSIAEFTTDSEVLANVTCIRYVEKNEDFYQLIYGAKLFLFLSLIEGFGFPPIEAMQLETPVVCSNTSSLPEVVSDAAVCVDPNDRAAVAAAMTAVIEDDTKCSELCRKGLQNAERFSWSKTGRKYREVLFG